MHRISSAGSARGGGARSNEVVLLQGTVEALKQELHYSRVEIARVSDQLNCLIMLVKRAWTGDKTAAVHVANIVGVAPPDISEEYLEDAVTLTAKPKSRALQNWAILTIGILNRDYRLQERDMEVRQQHHLEHRMAYLEEQLQYQRELVPSWPRRHNSPVDHVKEEEAEENDGNMWITQSRPPFINGTGKQPKGKISAERPPSGVKPRKPKPLFRPASQEMTVTVGDLVCEPVRSGSAAVKTDTDKVFNGLYRLTNTNTRPDKTSPEDEDWDEDKMHIAYDDPARYAKFGLFDLETAGNEQAPGRSRPVSAVLQQNSDNIRARPKSAVTSSSRPLKYETTRPWSGKSNASSNGRVKSAPQRWQNSRPSSQRRGSVGEVPTQQNSGLLHSRANSKSETHLALPQDRESVNGQRTAKGRESARYPGSQTQRRENAALAAKIKKPASVVQFEEDLIAMNDMEREFQKTTIELQKKLGITPKGMVY